MKYLLFIVLVLFTTYFVVSQKVSLAPQALCSDYGVKNIKYSNTPNVPPPNGILTLEGDAFNCTNQPVTLYRYKFWCAAWTGRNTNPPIYNCSSNGDSDIPLTILPNTPDTNPVHFKIEQKVGNTGTCGAAQVDYQFTKDYDPTLNNASKQFGVFGAAPTDCPAICPANIGIRNITKNVSGPNSPNGTAFIKGTIYNNSANRITQYQYKYNCDSYSSSKTCNNNQVINRITVPAGGTANFSVEQKVGDNGICGSSQVSVSFDNPPSSPQPSSCVDSSYTWNTAKCGNSWFNSLNGNVYSKTGGIFDEIPTELESNISGSKYWLIGKTGNTGGTAISSGNNGNIIANQTGQKQISQRGVVPGWNISNANFVLNYFGKLSSEVPVNTLTCLFGAPLVSNKSCYFSAQTPSTWTLNSSGVATAYYNGPGLNINGNITNSNANQGLIIFSKKDIRIGPNVTQIDALLISEGNIIANPSSNTLTVNGGLFAKGNVDLSKRSLPIPENDTDPAVTVNFRPIYLTNTNSDFIKNSYYWKELTPE